jgi:hypothetical protein
MNDIKRPRAVLRTDGARGSPNRPRRADVVNPRPLEHPGSRHVVLMRRKYVHFVVGGQPSDQRK